MALQDLQQELTAKHEAVIEATKIAYCEEIESLKEALSSKTVEDLSMSMGNKTELGNGSDISSRPLDTGDLSNGRVFCEDTSLGVRSLKDLALLYHNECKHTAYLQSRLNTVTEFITLVDNLDQSRDTVKEDLSSELCKNESDIKTEKSITNIVAAVHTFALSFRQAASDFPLQVENLQRLNRCNSCHMRLSVQEANDEACDLLTPGEPSDGTDQPASCYREISSSQSTGLEDNDQRNESETGISANVELSEAEHRSPVHSDTELGNEDADDGKGQMSEITGEAEVVVKVTSEVNTSNEELVTHSSSDAVDGQPEEQLNILNRELASDNAKLKDAVAELSEYKEKYEGIVTEMSRLRKDVENLQTVNTEIANEIAEKSMFEKQCSELQSELDKMKERMSELLEEASRLRKDEDFLQHCVDSLQKKAQDQVAELETKNRTIEMLDDKVSTLSSDLDNRSEDLAKKSSELEGINESLVACSHEVRIRDDKVLQLRAEIAQHENQRQDLTNELHHLKENITALESEADALKNQLGQKSKEFESTVAERVFEHQTKIDALTEELQASHSQVTKLADELQHMKHSSSELEKKVEMSNAENTDLQQQLVLLRSELETCRQESEQSLQLLSSDRDLCHSKLQDKDSELIKSAGEICCLRENIEQLNAEISEKDIMNKAMEAKLHWLTEQYDAKFTEMQSSVKERTAYEQMVLTEDRDSKAAELIEMKQAYEQKQAEVKEVYETKIEQLSSKIDELQSRLESDKKSLDAEIFKLTDTHGAELEAKDSEITTLKTTIDHLKETLSMKQDEITSATRNTDEMIRSAEESHKSEVAAVTESFEKKMAELENEHHHKVEKYRRRIVEMEQSDVELNTQLIAVTEKFNSVTEYAAGVERMIKGYRSKADKWTAEREDIVKMAETARAELAEREAKIIALQEQIQMFQPPSNVNDVPALNVKNDDIDEAAEISREACMVRNSANSSAQGVEGETCSPESTPFENDELVKLQQENFNLTQQLNQLQSGDISSLKEQHEQIVEQMRLEHRATVQDLEDQHNSKVIQLIKDFNAEMATHEKELRDSMSSDFG